MTDVIVIGGGASGMMAALTRCAPSTWAPRCNILPLLGC